MHTALLKYLKANTIYTIDITYNGGKTRTVKYKTPPDETESVIIAAGGDVGSDDLCA
jgi:hypothetical protein